MEALNKETQMILALQAMQRDSKLTVRAAASIYQVSRSTLGIRLNGIISRRDTMPNLRKLTDLEGFTIIQYILDLDSRSFLPVSVVWKIWPIDCSLIATRPQLDHDGLQTLSSATRSSLRVLRVDMTTRGLNAKIQP